MSNAVGLSGFTASTWLRGLSYGGGSPATRCDRSPSGISNCRLLRGSFPGSLADTLNYASSDPQQGAEVFGYNDVEAASGFSCICKGLSNRIDRKRRGREVCHLIFAF
jgi:hypothetical protein